MESVEVSAKSVDEAIDIALDELGLKRQQVHIEILTSGKPGLFGIGGEPARVRVTALEEGTARPISEPEYEVEEVSDVEIKDIESPEVDLAADNLTQLLSFMEIDAEIEVRPPETPGDGLGRASAVLDVGGPPLAALQYMVNLMVSRKMGSRVLISIDVEHYRRRREDSLIGLARRMADRVRQTGRSIPLEPMPAAEGRIVHLVLSDDGGVTTGSVGEGDGRKVVIYPRRSR